MNGCLSGQQADERVLRSLLWRKEGGGCCAKEEEGGSNVLFVQVQDTFAPMGQGGSGNRKRKEIRNPG